MSITQAHQRQPLTCGRRRVLERVALILRDGCRKTDSWRATEARVSTVLHGTDNERPWTCAARAAACRMPRSDWRRIQPNPQCGRRQERTRHSLLKQTQGGRRQPSRSVTIDRHMQEYEDIVRGHDRAMSVLLRPRGRELLCLGVRAVASRSVARPFNFSNSSAHGRDGRRHQPDRQLRTAYHGGARHHPAWKSPWACS